MSYTPRSSEHFSELIQAGLDANAATTSTSLDIQDDAKVAFSVVAATGTHATHVVTLQCSLDDSAWQDTSSTVTGVGVVDNISITTRYVRLKVTTNEGGTSTIDIIIQGK